jgi:hypothetical protein
MGTTAVAWTCPNCLQGVETPFCPQCGERPVEPPDLGPKGIAAQAVKSIGGIDGRFFRSLRMLVSRPGALTEAYLQGRRKPFLGPFPLFFLANVLFFSVQSLTHTKIFSSTLDSHLHRQDWSELAQRMVSRHLTKAHLALDSYAPIFDQAVVLNAKALVVLMALPFAALLPLLFHRSRQPFAVHVAFSLHLYAFLLLMFCVALGIAAIDLGLGGAGLASARMDNVLTALNLAVCATYVYLAIGRVYGLRGVLRGAAAVGLTLAVGAIVLGYRFMVFAITLFTT